MRMIMFVNFCTWKTWNKQKIEIQIEEHCGGKGKDIAQTKLDKENYLD